MSSYNRHHGFCNEEKIPSDTKLTMSTTLFLFIYILLHLIPSRLYSGLCTLPFAKCCSTEYHAFCCSLESRNWRIPTRTSHDCLLIMRGIRQAIQEASVWRMS